MQATIISDTSCLILLEKIEQINLLQKLFGQIIITQIVATEFDQLLPEWILVANPADKNYQLILEASLDKGEVS